MSSKFVIGVDVGGTTVKMGYFDLEGNVIDKWEIPTRTEDNGANIIPDIAGSILVRMKQEGIDMKEVIQEIMYHLIMNYGEY